MTNAQVKAREAIIIANKRGDLLLAYDMCQKVMSSSDDPFYPYQAVLALARCGSIERALEAFVDWQLDKEVDEDTLALKARLLKDQALNLGDLGKLKQAAECYLSAFNRTKGYFPAINAATLFLLSGENSQAEELALLALELATEKSEKQSYYALVTQAEALLVLNRSNEAKILLPAAVEACSDDIVSMARSRMQLSLICEHHGIPVSILDELINKKVFHYCGHILNEHQQSDEQVIARQISAVFDQHKTLIGYGSLAAGSDILFAEELIRRGGTLNVFLPFNSDEFKRVSVIPAGGDWEQRFDNCIARAATVSQVTYSNYNNDDSLFAYCTSIAMGQALICARQLQLPIMQLAVWDGKKNAGVAGTYSDIISWQTLGHDFVHIPFDRKKKCNKAPENKTDRTVSQERELCALLFCDIRGFSKLTDDDIPWYNDTVLPALADVISRYKDEILFQNTWGDAIYLVSKSATAAANVCFEIHQVLSQIDQNGINIPMPLALRAGLHYGPVYRTFDPILNKDNFFGVEVNRTARIEPVTPPGESFATEAFSSILALENTQSFEFDYAGEIPAAKEFGTFRMFKVRKATTKPV